MNYAIGFLSALIISALLIPLVKRFATSLGAVDNPKESLRKIHKGVMAKLQTLGYTTRIDLYGDYYVPRGLQNDDGGGPEHCNYGMIIGGW
mgnify:CR=1 FL=1